MRYVVIVRLSKKGPRIIRSAKGLEWITKIIPTVYEKKYMWTKEHKLIVTYLLTRQMKTVKLSIFRYEYLPKFLQDLKRLNKASTRPMKGITTELNAKSMEIHTGWFTITDKQEKIFSMHIKEFDSSIRACFNITNNSIIIKRKLKTIKK